MTTLPPSTDFTGASVTEGQFKTAITALRDYLSQLLGDDSTLREGDDLLINGAMNVDQEAGSFAGVGAATQKYVLDQWAIHTNGSPQGRATVTQESGVFAGFGYSLKIDCTTAEAAVAAGESWTVQHRIEAQELQHLNYGAASAKSLVCTFNIKSPKSGTHCVALYQNDGSRSIVKEFTVASANTAEEITVTFPGDASGTINNDTGEGLRLSFPLVAGSTYQVAADAWAAGEDYATSNQQNLLDNTANNFEITGVRLRTGTVATATPFVHRPLPLEISLSKRYYERIDFDDFAGQQIDVCYVQATNATRWFLRYVEKRINPTINFSAAGTFDILHSGGIVAVTSIEASTDISKVYARINAGVAATPFLIDEAIVLRRDTTDTTFVEIDARL